MVVVVRWVVEGKGMGGCRARRPGSGWSAQDQAGRPGWTRQVDLCDAWPCSWPQAGFHLSSIQPATTPLVHPTPSPFTICFGLSGRQVLEEEQGQQEVKSAAPGHWSLLCCGLEQSQKGSERWRKKRKGEVDQASRDDLVASSLCYPRCLMNQEGRAVDFIITSYCLRIFSNFQIYRRHITFVLFIFVVHVTHGQI